MDHVRWIGDRPSLRNPVLIVAFEGWNDAGDAATTAAEHVIDTFDTEPFADLDPEPFYDFTSSRPYVRIDDDQRRRIEWPANEFSAAVVDHPSRDLLVLSGVEPQLKWRTYGEQVVAMAREFDVSMVVSLGALIADVVHSRPVTLYGATDDHSLGARLGLEPSSYEGPTGIVGVVHEACQRAGLGSISLWATVPSYVPHAPSPKAALALIDRLGQLLELPILGRHLVEATAEYESQINDLVAEDEETRSYVERLEQEYDARIDPESGTALIEELERFLKDQ